jgi:hypothetical protein
MMGLIPDTYNTKMIGMIAKLRDAKASSLNMVRTYRNNPLSSGMRSTSGLSSLTAVGKRYAIN